jgi:parallel beta-helix repeat protein
VVAGPQSAITCPVGAVSILPGSDIQSAVNASPAGTTFCLGTGTFRILRSVTPKSGDSFVGQYGAVLDGTGWSTSDTSQGAFRAWNQNIDDVTIRNLVIRNMPQRGVNTFSGPDRWVIDHNEISLSQIGVHHSNAARVTNNYIHDNRQYGLAGFKAVGALVEGNEIAYNNTVSNWPGDMGGTKWAGVSNLTIRGNYVHHNHHHGVWLDGALTGNLIEDNVVVDNKDVGIFYEVSGQGVIRNNRIAGNTQHGIYVSNSRDSDIYGNTLMRNGGVAIQLFLDGNRTGYELRNNVVHDNVVDASDALSYSNHIAAGISCSNVTDSCSAAADSMNNRFEGNTFNIPTLSGYFFYLKGYHRTWSEWLASGRDTTGSAY